MDSGIDEDSIVNFVTFLYEKSYYDSRDLSEEEWEQFRKEFSNENIEDIAEFLENEHDVLFIPEMMDYISSLHPRNVLMTGGGINECLREVELACQALNLSYELNNKYTY